MSSLSSSVLSQLQCRVCQKQFDDATHKPIILHGSCSFCVECLDKLKTIGKKERGFVECPLCKTRAAKSTAATNHAVLEIVIATLQSLKLQAEEKKEEKVEETHDEICDLCLLDGLTSPAEIHCWDCTQWLCLDHARIHSRKKDKAGHGTNTLAEIRSRPELQQRASLVVRFPVHYCRAKVHGKKSAQIPDNKMEFYCVECNQFICARCAGLDHSTHEKRDLSTQWQEQEATAALSISTAKSLNEQHEACTELIQQLVSSFDQSDDSISSEARLAIAQIVTSAAHAIDQQNRLVEQIKQSAAAKRSAATRQVEPIKSIDLENDEARVELEAALEARDFVAVDNAYNALLDRMNQCMQSITQMQGKLRDSSCSNLGIHAARKPVVHEILKHLRDLMSKWFDSITIESTTVAKSFVQPSALEEPVEKPIVPEAESPTSTDSSSSGTTEEISDTDVTWQSVLARIRENPTDTRELIQIADDLYYLSSDRDGHSMFLKSFEWQEITLFMHSHLKEIELLPALSEAVINLVIYHYSELDITHLNELLDLSSEMVASNDSSSLVHNTCARMVWALPVNNSSPADLEKWTKLGLTAIHHGIKNRDPDPMIEKLSFAAPTLKHLECNVPLSQIGIRALITQMPNLTELRSFGFKLTDIKISDDMYKELFDTFKHVPDLSRLALSFPDCHASRFIGPSLKHCTNLMRLDLSSNTMGDTGFQSISQSLKFTPSLVELNLSSCGIGDFEVVGQTLSSVPRLRKLSLENNSGGMSKAGGKVLCQSLKFVPSLRELNLNATSMNSAACLVFAEHMHHLPLLEELYLSNNPICTTSPTGFKTLCAGFARMRNLSTLQMDAIDLNAASSTVLGSHFSDLKALQKLSLAANLQSDACTKLAPNLKDLVSLTELDLTNTRLSTSPAAAMALLAQLNTVPRLKSLSLGGNHLGEKGSRSLAESLRHVPDLRFLDLSNTHLSDTGCKLVCEAFKDIPKLTVLNLCSNSLGAAACRHLCDNLFRIPLLRVLIIGDNPWSLTEVALLCQYLKQVPQLRALNFDKMKLGDHGAKCIADHLDVLPRLRELVLTECQIADSGLIALANKFASLNCLTALDVSKNLVTRVGAKVLFTELPKLRSLMTLDFTGNKVSDEDVQKLQREHEESPDHKDCHCCKRR